MEKVLLLYNPHSGRKRKMRLEQVQTALAVLQAAGVHAVAVSTEGPGSAGEQAREAVKAGYDTVIACGGDGTVHEALQGLVGSPGTLGVIPLGTGNALAYDLGLPRDPAAAARAVLTSISRQIPVGRLEFPGQARSAPYFLTVAGVGADAEMLYRLGFALKSRYGILSYYLVAARLWLTHRFVPFSVEFNDLASGLPRREEVSQILAVHIGKFGDLLCELAPGAALGRTDFHLVLFKTASRFLYLRYVLGVCLRGHWPVAGVETVRTSEVVCTAPRNPGRVYVEADGELLNTLPVRIQMVPETISLLIPQQQLHRFSPAAEDLVTDPPAGSVGLTDCVC